MLCWAAHQQDSGVSGLRLQLAELTLSHHPTSATYEIETLSKVSKLFPLGAFLR